MAKFNTIGLDDIEKALLLESEKAKSAVPQMLKAGGEVLADAQKKEAKRLKIEFRGDLIKSIKVSKVKTTSKGQSIEVAPTGKNSAGVRNAEVGFLNEYGTSRQEARPWQSTANLKSEEEVHRAMKSVWEA